MTKQESKLTSRGRTIMKRIEEEPLRWLEKDMQETTPEEAAEIWSHIKLYLPIVAARTGMSKNGMKWGHLLRKMQVIEARSKESAK